MSTTFRRLVHRYEAEASAKWCKYYPNKNSYRRNFERWPRGKAVSRLLSIETDYGIRIHLAELGVNNSPASAVEELR